MVDFNSIKLGDYYSRKDLARLWNYNGHQAFSRGVFTPKNDNKIILFVTAEKQTSLTQYVDHISEDYLYWEGEQAGGNNNRIISSSENGDSIHLFYRSRHHQYFEYKGTIVLLDFTPSTTSSFEFIFKTCNETDIYPKLKDVQFENNSNLETEKPSIELSRIGQGKFRADLMKLWKGCGISGLNFPEILIASHIKSWSDSDNQERLNPYNGLLLNPIYDALFDKHYITFEDNGTLILGARVKEKQKMLNISGYLKLTRIYKENIPFLTYHRNIFFDKKL